MDETNANSLDSSREQPVLNIIYEHNKGLESSGNAIFTSQFDSFDMSQIALQTDNDMDIGLSVSNSTSMSSILPRSVGGNGGQQADEQRAAPITTASDMDASLITRNTHLMIINPKENCSELVKLSQVCPRYSKVIAKADTTNESDMQIVSGHEKASQENNVLPCESERNTLSFTKNFQSTIQSDSFISSAMDTTARISECANLLQCHMCGNQGFTTEGLKEHLKSHRGEKEYQCSVCLQRFCTNSGLSRHMRTHVNKLWKCTTCHKILDNKQQLKLHNKIHADNWNVSSVEPDSSQKESIPNPVLPSITALDVRIDADSSVSEKVLLDTVAERKIMDCVDENMEKKEKREYTNKCKYCPKTFRKPSDLIRHIRTHTGERPFKCDHCSKSFAVKCTLDSHMKVHTGKKTFRCHVCSSLFATKGSLKVHMRLHTGSKPFKCPMCDLRFRTSGHKKVHMLKHAREHKGGAKRKPKHLKVAAVAEAAASLENVDNSLDRTSATTTTATSTATTMTTVMSDETVVAVAQQQQSHMGYPALDASVNLDAAGAVLPSQITFNQTDATTILNNNAMLSVNESNELVANLQFLLANGLVTIQTDDSLLTTQPTGDSDAVVPTNVIELVNPSPFPESCDLNTTNHVVITSPVQVPTTETTSSDATNDAAVIQMNDCVPVSAVQVDHQAANGSGVSNAKAGRAANSGVGNSQAAKTAQSRKECDVCGKTFTKPCQVERHKRIHTGERPYKCELCSKSFAQKFSLQLHQKHHTGDRPYPCPHCKHSFTQKCNLQTHLKRVHQLVMLDIKKLRSGQQVLGALLQDNQGDAKLVSLDDILVVDFLK